MIKFIKCIGYAFIALFSIFAVITAIDLFINFLDISLLQFGITTLIIGIISSIVYAIYDINKI
jgi:hypothetical protein